MATDDIHSHGLDLEQLDAAHSAASEQRETDGEGDTPDTPTSDGGTRQHAPVPPVDDHHKHTPAHSRYQLSRCVCGHRLYENAVGGLSCFNCGRVRARGR